MCIDLNSKARPHIKRPTVAYKMFERRDGALIGFYQRWYGYVIKNDTQKTGFNCFLNKADCIKSFKSSARFNAVICRVSIPKKATIKYGWYDSFVCIETSHLNIPKSIYQKAIKASRNSVAV